MLNKIVSALKGRSDLSGWTVRHVLTRDTQVYAVPKQIEARRSVDGEKYVVDVLCQTKGADGSPAVGNGDATLLPGGDIAAGIEKAALVAKLVSNPVYNLPAPAPLPDVPLVDADLKKAPDATMQSVMERIRSTAAKYPDVRLTAAECFGEIHAIHLVNSRGMDVEQEATEIDAEFTLIGQRAGHQVETFREMGMRRVADLNLEAEIERQAGYTRDLLEAGAPPSWQEAVVLRQDALATFMAGDSLGGSVLRSLGSAASKYSRISSWEVGKPVFRREVTGDPLTVWANRCIPYGTGSNLFDDEGLPAQRVELIRRNELVTFTASQRYADYLKLPPTGAFGGVELPPGQTPASALLDEPYVEIIQCSWVNPDLITGDFATEIRLGYWVENGVRKPFKGGQLIGNYMDALADVRWSAETGFFGSYLGPHTARFNNLKVAGDEG